MSRLKREQRVVAAHADLVAGVKLGAALAHDDVAGDDDLAAVLLHPQPASGAVAAVARRAACLFVCHLEPSSPLSRRSSSADYHVPGRISSIRSTV